LTLSIVSNESVLGTVFFQGASITGPAAVDHSFYAPSTPGTYFFCSDADRQHLFGDFVVTAP
jgi:hypothetical protein